MQDTTAVDRQRDGSWQQDRIIRRRRRGGRPFAPNCSRHRYILYKPL